MGEVSHYKPIRRIVDKNIVLYYHNYLSSLLSQSANNIHYIQDYYLKKTVSDKLKNERSKNPFLELKKKIWEFERIGCDYRLKLLFPPISAWEIVKSKDSPTKSAPVENFSPNSNSVAIIDRLRCGNNYINCGKSISQICWRPNLSSDRQILACLAEFEDDLRSFIEIWDCGSIRNELQLKPVLKYCLVQDHGKINEMMWLTPDSIDMDSVESYPYKLNDFSTPQQLYGHLLLVGADGSMRIIPVPEFLGEDVGDTVPVPETVMVTGKSAVLRLGIGTSCDLDTSSFFGSPTCVGWNSRFSWSLVVGYSSGYIAIFDLSCAHHTRFDYMNNYLGAVTHVRVSYSPITSVALSPTHSPQINITVKPHWVGVNNFTVDLNQLHQLVDMFHLDEVFWKSIWPSRSDILISVSLKRDKIFIKMILSPHSIIIPIDEKITSISFSDCLNTLLIGTEGGALLGLSLNESRIIRCLMESDNSVDLTTSLFTVRYYQYGYKTSEKGLKTTTLIDCTMKNDLTKLSDIYDMSSANPRVSCVAVNPNIVASNWVAVALDCGLIHLQRFSERDFFPVVESIIDATCPNTKTVFLPSIPIKKSKKPTNVRKTATKVIERSDKKKSNKSKANTILNGSPQKINSKNSELTIESTDRKKTSNKKTNTVKSKKSPRKQKRRFSTDSDSNDINEIIKQSLEIFSAQPFNSNKKIFDADSYDSSATEKMSDSVNESCIPSDTPRNAVHPLPTTNDNESDNQTDLNSTENVEVDLKSEDTSFISQNDDYLIDDRLSLLESNEKHIDEDRPVKLMDQLKVDPQRTLVKEKIDDENRVLVLETRTSEIDLEETNIDYVDVAVTVLLENIESDRDKTDDMDGDYLINTKNTDLSNNTKIEPDETDDYGTYLVHSDVQFRENTETEVHKIDGVVGGCLVNTKNTDLSSNTELENTEMEQNQDVSGTHLAKDIESKSTEMEEDKTDDYGTHLVNTDLQMNVESENIETELDKIDSIVGSHLVNAKNIDLSESTEMEQGQNDGFGTNLENNIKSESTEMEEDKSEDYGTHLVNIDLQINTESENTETELNQINSIVGSHLVNAKNTDFLSGGTEMEQSQRDGSGTHLANYTESDYTEMEQDKTDSFDTRSINVDLQFTSESENHETERDEIDHNKRSYLATVANIDLPVNTELSINTVSENIEMERDNKINESRYKEQDKIENSMVTQPQPRIKLVSYSSDSEDSLSQSQKNLDSDSEFHATHVKQVDADSQPKSTSTDYLVLSSNQNESVDESEKVISKRTDQTAETDPNNSPSSDSHIHIIFDESDLNVEYSDSDGKSIDNSPFKTLFDIRPINAPKREMINVEKQISSNTNVEIPTDQPEAHNRHGNVFQFLNTINDTFCIKQETDDKRPGSDLAGPNGIESNHSQMTLTSTDSDDIIKKDVATEPNITNEDYQQILLNQTNSDEIIKYEVDLETENGNSALTNEDLCTNKVGNHLEDSCFINQNLSAQIHSIIQTEFDGVSENYMEFQSMVETSVNNLALLSNNTDACEGQSSTVGNENSYKEINEICSQTLFNQTNPDCVIDKEITSLPSFIISIDSTEELTSNNASQSSNIDENSENIITRTQNDIETVESENVSSNNTNSFEIQSSNIEHSRTTANIDENKQITLDETEIKPGTIFHDPSDLSDDLKSSNTPVILNERSTGEIVNSETDLETQTTNRGNGSHMDVKVLEAEKMDDQSTAINQLITVRENSAVTIDNGFQLIEEESGRDEDQSEKHLDSNIDANQYVDEINSLVIKTGIGSDNELLEERMSNLFLDKINDHNRLNNLAKEENVINIDRSYVSDIDHNSPIEKEHELTLVNSTKEDMILVTETNTISNDDDESIKTDLMSDSVNEVSTVDTASELKLISERDQADDLTSNTQINAINNDDDESIKTDLMSDSVNELKLISEGDQVEDNKQINSVNNDDDESIKTDLMCDSINDVSTNDTASEPKLISEEDQFEDRTSDTQINAINKDDDESIKTDLMTDSVNDDSVVKWKKESNQGDDPVLDTQTNIINNQSEHRSDIITKICSVDQSSKEANILEDSNENKSIPENNYQSVESNFDSVGDTIDSDVNVSVGAESRSDLASELSITNPIPKKIRKRKPNVCNPDLILPEKRIRRAPLKYRISPKKSTRTPSSTPAPTNVKKSSTPKTEIDPNVNSVRSLIKSTLSRDTSNQSNNESDIIKTEKVFFDFCEPENSQSRKRKTSTSQTASQIKKPKTTDEQPVTNPPTLIRKSKQLADLRINCSNKRLSSSNPIKENPIQSPPISPRVSETRKKEKLDNKIPSIVSNPAPNPIPSQSPAPSPSRNLRKLASPFRLLAPAVSPSSRSTQKLCTINQFNSQIAKKLETSTDIDSSETPLLIQKVSRKVNVVDNPNKLITTSNRKSNRLICVQNKSATAASEITVTNETMVPKTNEVSNEPVSRRTKGLRNKKEQIESSKIPVTSDATSPVNCGHVSPNTTDGKSGKKVTVENWWHSRLIQIKWLDNKYGEQCLKGVLFNSEPIVGQNTNVRWPKVTSRNLYPVTVLKIL